MKKGKIEIKDLKGKLQELKESEQTATKGGVMTITEDIIF